MTTTESMRDIPEAFLVKMGNDSALRAILGIGIDGDPRIYLYYNSEALIDDERGLKAYITYAQLAAGEQFGGTEQPVYSFVIWAHDPDIVEQVRDRLVSLFNKKPLVTVVRTVYGKKVQENDSYQDQPKFAGKTLHFRFGYLSLSEVGA